MPKSPAALSLLIPLVFAINSGVSHEQQLPAKRLTIVQSVYLENCGGCHGINGVSAPHAVPNLKGQVDRFLCTQDGRAYLVRLPSVALSSVSDEMLAKVMNFVVFELGNPDAKQLRAPYTEAEVAQLRKRPLIGTGLASYRTGIVHDLIKHCGAPASLLSYTDRPQ